MGEFLKEEMLAVSSVTSFEDSSRSLATLVASFPVSFWIFYNEVRSDL